MNERLDIMHLVSVLPNTFKELIEAIYDQSGDSAITREDALNMADFLEKERYDKKDVSTLLISFGDKQ